jgi:hypothetical protein
MNRLKELGVEQALLDSLQETMKGRFFTEQQTASRV